MNELELTGRARTHVASIEAPSCVLHAAVVQPFMALRAAAADEGFDLVPLSSFRDFERQLAIWNAKFRGERALLDRNGEPLVHAGLDEAQLLDAILTWSALPGASRHHWGTEIDVVDRASLPQGPGDRLVPAEFEAGGAFERLAAWLERHSEDFGFYRPYERDRGGVQREPWHLSYAPVAHAALASLTPGLLREVLACADIAGRELVLARLPQIFERYVLNVGPAPAQALAASAMLA